MSMRRAAAIVATVGLAVAAACATREEVQYRSPPSTVATTTTPTIDYRGVPLGRVAGVTTTVVDDGPGGAELNGRLTAPDGAGVGGAVVRAERFVGDAVVTKETLTRPDGVWVLGRIKGGRYRVRAWRVPDLADVDPAIFFLGGSERRPVPLELQRYTGPGATASVTPDPPVLGQLAQLAVQATAVEVDGQGIVRTTPRVGEEARLVVPPSIEVIGSNLAITDVAGSAFFTVRCLQTGPQAVSIAIGLDQLPLAFPDCIPLQPLPPSAPGPFPPVDRTPRPTSPPQTFTIPTRPRG